MQVYHIINVLSFNNLVLGIVFSPYPHLNLIWAHFYITLIDILWNKKQQQHNS